MHSTDDQVIAANVARLANEQGVRLKALASSAGISHDRLRDFLANGRGSLVWPEVESLARCLAVAPSALTAEVAA